MFLSALWPCSSLCRNIEGKVVSFNEKHFVLVNEKGQRSYIIREGLDKNLDQFFKKNIGKLAKECVHDKYLKKVPSKNGY